MKSRNEFYVDLDRLVAYRSRLEDRRKVLTKLYVQFDRDLEDAHRRWDDEIYVATRATATKTAEHIKAMLAKLAQAIRAIDERIKRIKDYLR